MNPAKHPILRTYLALSIALIHVSTTTTAMAGGLPVFDGANLGQNYVTAFESVAHTLKQIQQYKTQLDQYQNMLQNTAAPAMYIWDKANKTMNDLRTTMDTLSYYKHMLGNINTYLGKFKTPASYRSSPCFSSRGCSASDWKDLNASQDLGAESQKRAIDAMLRTVDHQQDALQADALQLQRLQASAQGAKGQMEALSYASQLASQQSNQLLQIRALLIAQQNMTAARYQALADREALARASDNASFKSTYKASTPRNW